MQENPKIIVIETSGRLGSVALAAGPELIEERFFSAQLMHTTELLPTIDALCRQHRWRPQDIDQLYVSAGPGSFTGLRIAITAAKTLAFAQETAIVAVPSMDALVLNAAPHLQPDNSHKTQVATIIEAGQGRVFAAVFEPDIASQAHLGGPSPSHVPGFITVVPAAQILPTDLLSRTSRPLILLGEGLNYHRQDFQGDGLAVLPEQCNTPSAANVHRCGWLRAQAGLFGDPRILQPIYLRRPEAEEKWEKLHEKT